MASTPELKIPTFAGLSLARPLIMGIVNVTPDSFSDAGETATHADAVSRGMAMASDGADIIDVGGESTRPGADPVDPEIEWKRIGPVIQQLAGAGIVVSVDTRHAMVMTRAVDAGAAIINDVTALAGEAGSLQAATASGAEVVLMHMQGTPKSMNDNPVYDDVVGEVRDYLQTRVSACRAAGIAPDRIAVDPGIGFGKTMSDNQSILEHLSSFSNLGAVLMIGISRKFGNPADRSGQIEKSISLAVDAVTRGAQILRVHDVAETVGALNATRRNEPATC